MCWWLFRWKVCILSAAPTFFSAWFVLRPQPRPSVFITSVSAYSRLEKHWFSQLSPAGHTWSQEQNHRKLKGRLYYLTHKWHKNPKMHADLWVTLILQHAVETLGFQAAGMLVCWFAVASLNFWQVGHVHLNFPHRLVGLTGKHSSHRISNNPEDLTIKTYNQLLVFPSAHLDELVGWWFTRIAVLF